MKIKSFLFVLIGILLIAGCNSTSPSNKEIKEIIYGLYIRDSSVLKKVECEITDSMAVEGHTNVWLIGYRFDSSDKPNSLIITESQNGKWELYSFGVRMDQCPK